LAEQGVTEELYQHVEQHRDSPEYSEAERVAIEYAERFALDHLSIDDNFMNRLREHFSDADVLDLTICIGNFMAFGRLTQVLQLDVACSIDGSPVQPSEG
jgi:alkylhydroperoxidase family enzyme